MNGKTEGRMTSVRFLRAAICWVCVFLAACVARAQLAISHPAIDPHHVDGSGTSLVDLSSTWLVKEGDDPSYANPRTDDSQWKVVQVERPLQSSGFGEKGTVWYRTHVVLSGASANNSIYVGKFNGPYDLYVNGTKVGSVGDFSDRPSYSDASVILYSVPRSLLNGSEAVVAIRSTLHAPGDAGFAQGGTLLFGSTWLLSELSVLTHFKALAFTAVDLEIETLIFLAVLALAFILRSEREYVVLALLFAASLGTQIAKVMEELRQWNTGFVFVSLFMLKFVCLVEFVRRVLGLRRSRWFAITEWLLVIGAVAFIASSSFAHNGASQLPHVLRIVLGVVVSAFIIAGSLSWLANLVLLPVLALREWWKRRNIEGLLLFISTFLTVIVLLLSPNLQIGSKYIKSFLRPMMIGGVAVEWTEVVNWVFYLVIFIFIVMRTYRIVRLQASLENELAAAQSVQSVLLSGSSVATAGFEVEKAYYPASQVGGDFFSLSTTPDGSLTAIVGDVSGKGMAAAMRVSMILGVLQREDATEPGDILRGLNQALLTQSDVGFTTACCVRIERDGNYVVANAGHIAPYVDGNELQTEASLPLGVADEQGYVQIGGKLATGARMVLLSDGVVEARAADGELYGFDRLCALSTATAAEIAETAKAFGQEDDITVLTIKCA